MMPRKSKFSYQVYIGTPSLGRVAVLPRYKDAKRVAEYYKALRIPARIVQSKRKEVVM